MKHYRNNHTFEKTLKTSLRDSKRNKYNLNSSKKNNQDVDMYLNKWLSYSYKFFAPFFEDEDFEVSYANEINATPIDDEFDKALPSWLKGIIDFIKRMYHLLFPKKLKVVIRNAKKVFKNMVVKPVNKKRSNTFKKSKVNSSFSLIDS